MHYGFITMFCANGKSYATYSHKRNINQKRWEKAMALKLYAPRIRGFKSKIKTGIKILLYFFFQSTIGWCVIARLFFNFYCFSFSLRLDKFSLRSIWTKTIFFYKNIYKTIFFLLLLVRFSIVYYHRFSFRSLLNNDLLFSGKVSVIEKKRWKNTYSSPIHAWSRL